jgi:CO/xanthine dehydrogenase FAD-binding subunit
MKPAVFDYVRAGSIAEPTRLLAEANDAARLVAGAQSLGPMLNLRLAQPRILIDITGIRDLTRIEDADDTVVVGACVTTANIQDGRLPGRGLDTLPAFAANIAYRAVRNRGTIGGSLCHADPASDWVSMLDGACRSRRRPGRARPAQPSASRTVDAMAAPVSAEDEPSQGVNLARLLAFLRKRFRLPKA